MESPDTVAKAVIRGTVGEESAMSLKAFHVLFVTISMLLAVGFGFWAVGNYRSTGEISTLVWGVGSWVAFIALGAYGRWFLNKLQGESLL